jgi:hypothetical protein
MECPCKSIEPVGIFKLKFFLIRMYLLVPSRTYMCLWCEISRKFCFEYFSRIRKWKSFCGELGFLNNVFYAFDAGFNWCFEKVVFEPSKINQGTCLRPSPAQKVVFGIVTYGPCDVFFWFLPVCNPRGWEGKVLGSWFKF